ncbi:MAG: hypothetical protein ACI9MC_000184 [Kiritimatiellia bacterium]|jgi:hypothetical protein
MRLLPVLLLTGCAFSNAYSAHGTIAETQCERAFVCTDSYPSDAPHTFESVYGTSIEDCVERLSPDPADQDNYRASEKAGDLVYSKSAAKSCVSIIEASGCDAFFADPAPGDCGGPFVGSVESGGTCSIDLACESSFCRDGACN